LFSLAISRMRQQQSLDLPERVLWAEVLREALFDLRRKEQDWRHGDAARWLASDAEYIGSFRFCCEVVGLAPSAIRRAVRGESLHISAWSWASGRSLITSRVIAQFQ